MAPGDAVLRSRSPLPATGDFAGQAWQIVPREDSTPAVELRVRDDARIQAVVRHLLAHECVALLGPPMSEKSMLLRDAAGVLRETGLYWPLYLDLWQAKSNDENTFFTSLAALISDALGPAGTPAPEAIPDARAFQNYLGACLGAVDRHLALLIDHLQALPHDLVHSLLLALRAAYMERDPDSPRQLVAVVTGGMNLVGLSTGPTSPFNIAKPVVTGPLTPEQTLALAGATFTAHGCSATPGAFQQVIELVGGDHYLVPHLCSWSAEAVHAYRRPLVTRAVVSRSSEHLWLPALGQPPIREAVHMIEEDPDTMLDVLHLLDHDSLPRQRSRQTITRTGTDRLQLSGAVVLADGKYAFKNLAYRQAMARHFTTERVGHVLRIAGRWKEAIEYLAPRLSPRLAPPSGSAEPIGRQPSSQLRASSFEPPAPGAGARPQLLEAIVQSIYAADSVERAGEILASGLRLGFGLVDVGIYRVNTAQDRLELIYPLVQDPGHPLQQAIDLHGHDSVESQTFHYGKHALRGSTDQARLVVALNTPTRPIGLVTVERFVEHRDPHETPMELPDLLRFLQHAANAIENVMMRAAYRKIGQAVLNASTLAPTLSRVLEAVSEALGCDLANLYLMDAANSCLEMAAGLGRAWDRDWQQAARLNPASRHPAASCLVDKRMVVVRGTDERLDQALVDRLGLRSYGLAYLPLQAGGSVLGTLELGYASGQRVALTEESRRDLTAFADQVAIAVHNMQLLRRTDEALARRVTELEKLRSSSLAITSTLDLDAVLARITRDVQALFPGTETTIWEYHPAQAELTVFQSSLYDIEYRAQRMPIQSTPGRAVTTRELAVAPDLQPPVPGDHHSSAPSQDVAARLGLRSMVAVPLVIHDRVLGAISVYAHAATEQPIGPSEAELLKAFAAQAAVAIDNARLHQEEVASQQLERELAVGRQIQLSMLPKACPSVDGWQFAAVYQAARSVGGDFYDFYDLPGKPKRLGVVVADVTDHGVPAAIFMALSRTIIRTTALTGRGPASALLRANELILKDSQSDMFLSAFYAVLDVVTGRLRFANAGHVRPLWYRAETHTVSELATHGLILGVLENITLEEAQIDVASGDVLVFYTDGVSEAMNVRGEQFGEQRLMEVVARLADLTAAEILHAVADTLDDFTGATEQADDITCVVVKCVRAQKG